jgi:hypothetical protein
MHAKPSQPSRDRRRDKRNQRALLALALYEFPNHLHRRDLGWQIAHTQPLERAIFELVTAGLLFCEGDEMLPTLPARHFDWLELP